MTTMLANSKPAVSDIVVRRPDELTVDERAAWERLTETLPAFDSPYFRPEFTDHVAAVRDDVHVAVLAASGEPVGFLPFQRRGSHGRPVGGPLSDFHGVVVHPAAEWSVSSVMSAVGLRTWRFDHLVDPSDAFERYEWCREGSPYVDLSAGYEAYESARRAAGAGDIKTAARKRRKLAREHDTRFEWRTDAAALETLVAWKNEQYRRTDKTVVFSYPWTGALLERLAAVDQPGFGGVLSGLYADDEPIAVHFGIRSRSVLHYWFPAYGTGFERYSPGNVLLLDLAREAADRGLRRIDLGKGNERYKLQFGSGAIEVAEGVVDDCPMGRLLRRGWSRTKRWVKAGPLARAARIPARMLRSWRAGSEFE